MGSRPYWNFDDLFGVMSSLPSVFFGGWVRGEVPSEALAGELVDDFYHVHGDADGCLLVCHARGDGLADPPGCVGGELEALE